MHLHLLPYHSGALCIAQLRWGGRRHQRGQSVRADPASAPPALPCGPSLPVHGPSNVDGMRSYRRACISRRYLHMHGMARAGCSWRTSSTISREMVSTTPRALSPSPSARVSLSSAGRCYPTRTRTQPYAHTHAAPRARAFNPRAQAATIVTPRPSLRQAAGASAVGACGACGGGGGPGRASDQAAAQGVSRVPEVPCNS